MDIRKVKKLIELLDDSGMAEIEIVEGDDSVRIVRTASPAPATYQASPMPAPAPQAAPATAAVREETSNAEPDTANPGHAITAPMVGTFYRSPSPGSQPFVDVGKDVEVGDIICIIEAMKMMNQIEADRAGRIREIQVVDGEPVEFGQPLFIIE